MAKLRGGEKWQGALDKLAKSITTGAAVDVGFLPNAKYPDGTPVAQVAAIQEYGAPKAHIPPRPFFRQMVSEQSPHWGHDVGTLLKQHDLDAHAALTDMGELIKGALVQKISTFSGVPLAPSTIKRKGTDKQLIDTTMMLNSVDSVVVDK